MKLLQLKRRLRKQWRGLQIKMIERWQWGNIDFASALQLYPRKDQQKIELNHG